MDLTAVLSKLVAAPGLAGREEPVRRIARELLAPYADAVWQDPLGNLILQRDGAAELPPLMLAAHADEVGFFVSRLTDEGFLRVAACGGIDVRNLLGQEVSVHGREELRGVVGTMPPHLTQPSDRRTLPPVEDLFIDVGLEADQLREQVQVGDPVTLRAPLASMHPQRVSAKALDNRASVAALWVCLRQLADTPPAAPVLGVLTVQEEVGVRGAVTAAYGLDPAVALAVDVGFGDQPGVEKADRLELGKGPAVAQGPNIHPLVRQRLLSLAEEHDLPHQEEVAPGQTGTDARAIQLSREGIPTGLVSIPLRYMHSAVELADLNDIRTTGTLLAQFARTLDAGWLAELQGGAVRETP